MSIVMHNAWVTVLPGGPCNSTPLGAVKRPGVWLVLLLAEKIEGYTRGYMTDSRKEATVFSSPPMS